MPDAHQDVHASTTAEIIDQVLNGLSALGDDEDEAVATVRARGAGLATAMVASALANDVEALHAFAVQIVELHPDGAGIAGAADGLTSMRLFGLPPMGLVASAVIGVRSAVSAKPTTEEQLRSDTAERIVTDIWTGRATHDMERYARGMAQLRDGSTDLVDDVLYVMARSVAAFVDTYEGWRVDGYEQLEDYRAEHPLPEPAISAPAAADTASSRGISTGRAAPTMLITAALPS